MTDVVLVTGAAGLNGSWVARDLLTRGYDVVGYDVSGDDQLVRNLGDRFEMVRGDLSDADELRNLMTTRHITLVVHFAAVLSVTSYHDPDLALRVNCVGTSNLLQAARRAGVRRVVFASSFSVFGPFDGPAGDPNYEQVDEMYPRWPGLGQRVYGATKILCEELGLHMSETRGPSFIALRFAHILAPNRPPRNGSQLTFNTLLDDAANGRAVHVDHGGDQRFDLLYIKDLSQSAYRACSAADGLSGVYNIGCGATCTLQDVAAAVRRRIPDAQISIEPGLDFLDMGPLYPVFDISKARAELNYEPEYGVDGAVADYLRETIRSGE